MFNGKLKIPCIIIAVLILLFAPLIIDKAFSNDKVYWSSLEKLKASEILGYFGSILSAAGAFLAVYIAAKQFRISGSSCIIPMRKELFYYEHQNGRSLCSEYLQSNEKIKERFSPISREPEYLVFKNVTDVATINFGIEIDYNGGIFFHEIMGKIGGTVSGCSFDKEVKKNIGVLGGKETCAMIFPPEFDHIIKHLCSRLHETPKNDDEKASYPLRRNIFLDNEHKIAVININEESINGSKSKSTFDVFVEIHSVANFAKERITIKFKKK